MENKPKIMSLDLETYSDVDLPKCGVYRYVEGDFHILLFAYAFDDDEVQCVDLACGEVLPPEVVAALEDPDIKKAAWNAQFERTCLSKYLGKQLSPDSWFCTMAHAASLSLPLSLKNAALSLKTGEQKDKAGENLIKYFSIPCKPTKANGGRTRNLPEHDPAAWARFKSYCIQDVKTERDIRLKLERLPMPECEWNYYHMDQRINDRGIRIDLDLVRQAITCDLAISEAMTNKAYELTGLENPNSVSQLKTWLTERGIDVDTLSKKDVAAMIADLDKHSLDDDALEMLKLRLQMAKSSVKKYQAAERYTCKDGRARGLFQFNGANRTGRFSGRGIQIQNLVQNHISTLDEARELVKMGSFSTIQTIYGNVPDILSQLLRTMLIPRDGYEFIVADFSAIEARVLAWLAGEDWRLDAFRNGEDIYCASASAMFHVPVVKHGINGALRQRGKVAELACIAEGQLVLTDKGLVPIEKVTTDMKVWDGEEWVTHDGVVYRGEREVITYDGLTATPDHLVWIEGKSQPIQFGIAAACGAHLAKTGDGRKAVRLGENYQSGKTMEQDVESLFCTDKVCRMQFCTVDTADKSYFWKIERLSALFQTETNSVMAGQEADGGKTEMRKSERPRLPQLWCKGYPVQICRSDGSGAVPYSDLRSAGKSNGNRPDRQQRRLCSRKSTLCDTFRKRFQSKENCSFKIRAEILALLLQCCYSETFSRNDTGRDNSGCGKCSHGKTEVLAADIRKARLYDIRNAGRHHRFTVSGKLVHNCGYGGSVGALISMGALDMGLKESELPDIISSWRDANPKIVQFWYDLEKAAIATLKDHEKRTVRKIRTQFYAGTLWIVLPSGRKLAYIKPRLQPNRFGRMALTYEGIGNNNKPARIETYSGKLVENITQSTARDILIEAMWRMEQAGLDIVGHVHDEVILEVPKGKYSVDEICSIMAQNPEWCPDLPLNAAGYLAPDYYFKD